MTEERISPLRARMIEDMRIRGMGEKAQKSCIRAIKDVARFVGHSARRVFPRRLHPASGDRLAEQEGHLWPAVPGVRRNGHVHRSRP